MSNPLDLTGEFIADSYLRLLQVESNNVYDGEGNYLYTIGGTGGGTVGPQGPTGAAGSQGSPGVTGPAGSPGTTGPAGSNGATGAQGVTGPAGSNGATGAQGEPGPTGSNGATGAQGEPGVTGPAGSNGATGAQGATGPTGSNGATGAQGEPGATGSNGATGAQGEPGVTGPAGSNGATGAQGEPGVTGATGSNGQSTSYYTYQAKTTTTSPPPGSGYVIWNNATQTASSQLTFSHLTQLGIDVDIFLNLLKVGDTIIIQDSSNSNNYQSWTVNGTLGGIPNTYVTVPVSYVAGGYSFTNNQNIIVAILTSGPIGITGATGAGGALGYYGNFYDTTSQPLVSPGTAQIVRINGNQGSVGFSLSGTGTVVIANPGTYTMIYSIQLKNTDNNIHYADIWLRYNGSDYPNSTTRFHVPARKNAGELGYAVATVNFVGTSVAPGDYVELWWHADSTAVSIEYLPAGVAPVHPATPSVIATFTQVMYTQLGPTGASGATGPQGATGNNGATGPTGSNGANGATGATGSNGANGATGSVGPTGGQGALGNFGGDSVLMTGNYYSSSPSLFSGFIAFISTNSGPTGTFQIDISNTDAQSGDITNWNAELITSTNPIKGYLRVSADGSSNNYAIYRIDSGTSGVGYYSLNVTPISSNGTINSYASVVVSFARTGDIGVTGPTGNNGANGVTGPTGNNGTNGVTGPTGSQGATGAAGTYTFASASTTYTATETSGMLIIKCNTTAGAFTVHLPTAVGNTATYVIKKATGTPPVTIDCYLSETVDEGATAVINKVYESVTLVSDNANWWII